MNILKIMADSVKKTVAEGENLVKNLRSGSVIALSGELGAGKTVFVKGIAKGLGVREWKNVTSPTFTILNIYNGKRKLYHFDLYRINKTEELMDTGFDAFVNSDGIAAVEWADKFPGMLPEGTVWVKIAYSDRNKRLIQIINRGTAPRARHKGIKSKITTGEG
ncbi:MAG TPA: tRNA (adenosine(37)-N6)-threonylcarbamoyltransferase complex ATPase subunit type 1 TsaE [bacterium]